jgi:hypothetical protein
VSRKRDRSEGAKSGRERRAEPTRMAGLFPVLFALSRREIFALSTLFALPSALRSEYRSDTCCIEVLSHPIAEQVQAFERSG